MNKGLETEFILFGRLEDINSKLRSVKRSIENIDTLLDKEINERLFNFYFSVININDIEKLYTDMEQLLAISTKIEELLKAE